MSKDNKKHFRINTNKKFVFRAAEDGTPNKVEGHAAVFNVMSEPLWELGGACEMILPGAFTRAIAEGDDVKALINHDASLLLARSSSGTLQLAEDEVGLWFSFTLPNTSYANDLKESMQRGDISQCSFAFCIDDADMQMRDGQPCQMIRSVSLSDVSVVTYPAYPQTDAALRSHYEAIIKALPVENNADINKTEPDGVPLVVDVTNAVDSIARRKREIEILTLL